jgi:hypothetical protein
VVVVGVVVVVVVAEVEEEGGGGQEQRVRKAQAQGCPRYRAVRCISTDIRPGIGYGNQQ